MDVINPLTRPAPLRILLAGIGGLLLVIVAGGVFDRVEWSLVVGPPVVTIVAWALRGRARRWRLLGAIGAMASSATVAVVSSHGSAMDLLRGVVDGPRQLITTEWPSPVVPSVLVTTALIVVIATATAADLAGRPRWHLAPLAPLLVGFVVLLALGAPVRPPSGVLAAFGVLAAALALIAPGDAVPNRFSMLLGDRTVAIVAVALVATGVGTSTIFTSTSRSDPRQIEPADVSATLLDPIEATAALRAAETPIPLFEVVDRSALVARAAPTRWRLAALDKYDGQRWVPVVTLRPIGERLGLAPPVDPGTAPPLTYDLTFLTDDIDLVPFPGRPLMIDAPVETDVNRVVVRLLDRPIANMTVRAESEIAPTLGTTTTTSFASRPVDDIAGSFADRARDLAGDSDVVEQKLRQIEATMHDEWTLDADAPGGGQQLALIERFVTDTQRGTREQFVTAFVLLARALGVDARVATGFQVPPEDLQVSPENVGSPLVIDSTHAAAWPEVRLADGRWIAFDPVPVFENSIDDEPTSPPEAQSPAAAQPPTQPPSDESSDDDDKEVVLEPSRGRWERIGIVVLRVGAVTSVALLPLILAIAAILALKWRRRRERLRLPDPARRVRGAWANASDSLIDAGLTVAPAWTDDHIALAAAPLAPAVPHELRRLAAMASEVTFGPTDGAERFVDDATTTSRLIDKAIRADRTRWQRLRWRLSLRSLRRRSRSPIVV